MSIYDGKRKELEAERQRAIDQTLAAEQCMKQRRDELMVIIEKQCAEHMLSVNNAKEVALKDLHTKA